MASDRDYQPIGYAWLAEEFKVAAMPHFVESFVAKPGERKTIEQADGRIREIYPWSQVKAQSVTDHLEFALKREGLHLQLLRAVLPQVPADQIRAIVQAKPTGANVRRLWYLWETFTGERLPIADLAMGNYLPLADHELYYSGGIDGRLSRWRLVGNLIGNIHFSPILRRTARLQAWDVAGLADKCRHVLDQYPANLYQRALTWLYAKETKSSYAIEHEVADEPRAGRFIALLRGAGEKNYFSEDALCALQKAIVDPRFATDHYRTTQNFVGQTLGPGHELVHLVPPKPGQNLSFLMGHWAMVAHNLLSMPSVPAVSAAAIVSYLFVYFHPFLDGNGRIHRFLIHHFLARRRFGPEGVILPVSAVMLNRPADYDASLEAFSKPLLERTEFQLSPLHDMTVTNETLDHFRYIDCTAMAEALYSFVAETIETELPRELAFLRSYDVARAAMREVVDLPEPHANLFLKLALQNQGRLSKNKRSIPQFEKLTDAEITGLEDAIRTAYADHMPEPGAL